MVEAINNFSEQAPEPEQPDTYTIYQTPLTKMSIDNYRGRVIK